MSKTIPMLPSLYGAGSGIPDHDLTEDDLLWMVDGDTGNPNRDRKVRVAELRPYLFGTQFANGVAANPSVSIVSGITCIPSTTFQVVKNAVYELHAWATVDPGVYMRMEVQMGGNALYGATDEHWLPYVTGINTPPATDPGSRKQLKASRIVVPTNGAAWVDGTGDNPSMNFNMALTAGAMYPADTTFQYFQSQMWITRIG